MSIHVFLSPTGFLLLVGLLQSWFLCSNSDHGVIHTVSYEDSGKHSCDNTFEPLHAGFSLSCGSLLASVHIGTECGFS